MRINVDKVTFTQPLTPYYSHTHTHTHTHKHTQTHSHTIVYQGSETDEKYVVVF